MEPHRCSCLRTQAPASRPPALLVPLRGTRGSCPGRPRIRVGAGAPSSWAEATSMEGSGEVTMAGPGEVGRGRTGSGPAPRPGHAGRIGSPAQARGTRLASRGRAERRPKLPSHLATNVVISAATPDGARNGSGEGEGRGSLRQVGQLREGQCSVHVCQGSLNLLQFVSRAEKRPLPRILDSCDFPRVLCKRPCRGSPLK